MQRQILAGFGIPLAAMALLVGCASPSAGRPTASAAPAPAPSSPSAQPIDEHGALTAEAVASLAPRWEASRFAGIIGAPDGHIYGGDCRASAWEFLALTEAATGTARTYRASGEGAPTPHLVIAVVRIPSADRQADLDALTHQFTSCSGEAPDGTVRQQPLTTLEGWSGLHQVADDRDLYWAPFAEGVVIAQLSPGADGLDAGLVGEVHAILAVQLDELP